MAKPERNADQRAEEDARQHPDDADPDVLPERDVAEAFGSKSLTSRSQVAPIGGQKNGSIQPSFDASDPEADQRRRRSGSTRTAPS